MKKLCIAGLGMIAMSAAPVFAQTEAAATPAAPVTQQEQASGGAAEGCRLSVYDASPDRRRY